MKKTIILLIVVIILAFLMYWWFGRTPVEEALTGDEALLEEDATSEILENLEGIDLGDLDSEFQDIDMELDQL